jgi:hypothetical protein
VPEGGQECGGDDGNLVVTDGAEVEHVLTVLGPAELDGGQRWVATV